MTVADDAASAASGPPGGCPVCTNTTHIDAHAGQSANTGRPRIDGGSLNGLPTTTLTYQRTAQLRIFLSYGHDRFQLLAFHLKHLLQERGHSVWVDVEKLKAGIDWEDGISGALTWVKEAQHDGRVVLLMTPHALRRPDGYCLNEIARAATHRLSIFPVLVAESEPPPAIAMLPYFDLRDCVPTDPAALALDPKSDEWITQMRECVHARGFEEKTQRLVAILELFETMGAYGVPAVAGLENLGLFQSTLDSPHHRDSRASSLRRLLTQSSTESINALAAGCQTSMGPRRSSAGSGASENSSRNLMSDVIEEADTEEDGEDDAAVFSVRYMFSFDDSCYALAQRLYEDLSSLGFSVFAPPVPPDPSDPESIQANVDSHEDALQWASEEKNGKMILLATPESVGRPSGVCLNDITAAMAAGMGFVPLMVRQCEIPLSICRIQWLDMSDCLIYHREQMLQAGGGTATSLAATASINESRYASRRDQLATALKGKLDHEGQQARLFALLTPFSFQVQISHLTQRFTGRDWLFKQLREWIDKPTGSKVFWITGQIGSGKSSVAAKLVQQIPEIAAFHFALQEDEQTQSSRRCLLSLAYQLTTQLPEYTMFLQSGEPLEEIVPVSSVQALMTHLLVTPLNAIARPQSDKPLVLLLDGLEHLLVSKKDVDLSGPPALKPSLGPPSISDGGMGTENECLVSLLPSLISRLPAWVRIVLLSREDHSIVMKLQNYSPAVALDHHEEENNQDIRAFVNNALCSSHRHTHHHPPAKSTHDSSSGPAPMLRHRSPSISLNLGSNSSQPQCKITSEQVDLITKRSEGLFLYAVNIVQSIEEGRLSVDQIESLPLGMGGYLRQFFESHFDEVTYATKIRPVLEVLCAAYEPITLTMLSHIFDWKSYQQHEMATTVGSLFFVSDDDYIRPFHSSVLEWVQDIKTAGVYIVDVRSGHECIGKWAAKKYQDVVDRKNNDFIKLNFELEASTNLTSEDKMRIYIVRHLVNHLMEASGDTCIMLVGKFASDENFQLARRLLSIRSEGLESFFHGDITRDRSQQLLATNLRPGSFLIRYSARQGSYCTSFIEKIDEATSMPKFKHNLIYHLKNGAYSVVPPEHVTEKTSVFPDLVSFVEEYQRRGILKAAIPRSAPLNREISHSAT